MADSNPIDVAIAVVLSSDCVLVGQRPAGVPLEGYWEFPGGKVYAGETAEEAAVRECREETGLAIRVLDLYCCVEHVYPHGAVRLHFFLCGVADARPAPCPPYRWTPREELRRLRFPPANEAVLARLLAESDPQRLGRLE